MRIFISILVFSLGLQIVIYGQNTVSKCDKHIKIFPNPTQGIVNIEEKTENVK